MRVAVQRSGGFANIGAHAEADTAKLPAKKAEELERMVKALPAQPPPPLRTPRAADVYQYDITVDAKVYSADELSIPDAWRALVDFLLEP